MKGANNTYWGNIRESFSSLKLGLVISWRHFKLALQGKKRKPLAVEDKNYFEQQDGLFTIQYPSEAMPVPDNGRYRLHNEMEDCIVCDKCAKICPVNCIDIEPIRSAEEVRKASDGTSVRMYAAKFDIDMAKCCFCGLCTTVCPTECLTMTKSYDFSEFEVANLTYNFTDLTPEQAQQKQEEFDIFQAAKKQKQAERETSTERPSANRPKGIAPKMKAPVPKKSTEETTPKPTVKTQHTEGGEKPSKPVIKPVQKKETEDTSSAKVKPVIKPKIPSPKKETENTGEEPKKPSLKPVIKKTGGALKPKIPATSKPESNEESINKPSLKPKIPGTTKRVTEKNEEISGSDDKKSPLKPVIKKTTANTGSVLKPKIPSPKKGDENDETPKKSSLKPKIPGVKKTEDTSKEASQSENNSEQSGSETPKPALKPKIPGAKNPSALKPKIKPKNNNSDSKE